jgi:tetratricopeptide (TPR) repeat protein
LNKISERNEWLKLARPLALLFAEEKRYTESLAVYNEMTKINEFGHIGWTGVGNNLWMLGRQEEAADAYSKALEIKPEYFDALYNYGLVNSQIGNLDIAISAYQNLIKIPVEVNKFNKLKQAKNYLHLWKNQQDK